MDSIQVLSGEEISKYSACYSAEDNRVMQLILKREPLAVHVG
jgi:hypothetical protein